MQRRVRYLADMLTPPLQKQYQATAVPIAPRWEVVPRVAYASMCFSLLLWDALSLPWCVVGITFTNRCMRYFLCDRRRALT